MARGIPLLRVDQLVIPVNDPAFSPLVAASLGSELTDDDGWDDAIAVAGLALGEDDSLTSSLADDLLGSDFIEGELEAQTVTPLVVSAGTFTTAGDALFSSMADAISADPSQPPSDGGGDGGQGGGDGGGGDSGGQGGGTGGGSIGTSCRQVVNPQTHEVTGIDCQPTESGGGDPGNLIFRGGR